MKALKRIVAVMRPDYIYPYVQMGELIPVVVKSNHPRFPRGTRFDYGFLRIALSEGYNIELKQQS
jgi:hypothetical protein